MNKRCLRKWLTGLLCVELLFSNITSTGILTNAAEVESTLTMTDENNGGEDIADVVEGDSSSDTMENEDSLEESADMENGEDEFERDNKENSKEDEGNTGVEDSDDNSIEDENVDSETREEDKNIDEIEENEDEEVVDDNTLLGDAEERLALMTSDDDIASGTSNNITWVIDANGKLTITGTGDYNQSDGALSKPWGGYITSIVRAEVNVTGMTDASRMFSDCRYMKSVDLNNFDTSKITDMQQMFYGCEALLDLDVSRFNTGNVINMKWMFCGCRSLMSLDVSQFNTSNTTDISGMFDGCRNLTSLDVRNFDTRRVTDMSGMFGYCSNLTSIDVSQFNTSNVTDMSDMFEGCSNLTSLDVSKFDTSKVTDMAGMFSGCNSLTSLDVSKFDTQNVEYMGTMLYIVSLGPNISKLEDTSIGDLVLKGMFEGCSSLTELDLGNFKTGNVKNMTGMFKDCSSLTKLNISNFDTGNVTQMTGMFLNCSSMTDINLDNFNTGNVENMQWMFYGCTSLKSLDLSNFKTGNVTNLACMFMNCSNLTDLNISKFDTSKVENMQWMFNGCNSLQELDLSSFNASNAVDQSESYYYDNEMFYNCTNLSTIKAPYNLELSVVLPVQSGDTWYDSNGKKITELPQNLSYSVIIMKNKVPDESIPEKREIYSFKYDENVPSKELAEKCALYSLLAYRESKLNKKGVLVDDNGLIKDDDRERLLGDSLHEDGYEDIYSYNYDNVNKVIGHVTSQKYDQTENSILYTIGHRYIETKNGDIQDQIVIVFRGTHDGEWYGNFDITGTTYNPNINYHQSFQSAVNDSMKSLSEYIKEMKSNSKLYGSDLSILITGHSRGAAVANMMAHEITDIRDGNVSGYTDEMNVDKFSAYNISSVYAYTYATPNVATYKKISSYGEYNNIFNYCFTDDFVPNLPMEGWSWGKYGRTYWAQAANVNVDLTFQNAAKNYYGKTAQFNTKYTNSIVSTILKATNPSGVDSYYNFKRNRTNPWDKISLHEFVRSGLGGTMQGKLSGYATLLGVYAVMPPLADEYFYALSENFIFGGKLNPALNYAHQCASYYIAITVSFNMFKYSELNENGYAVTTYSIDTLESDDTTEYNEQQVVALKEFLANEITIDEYDYTVTNAELLEWDIDDISTWEGVIWNNGSVVSLDLSYAGITGPFDLSPYTELLVLDCSYGNLTELDFSNCKKLTKINCDGNQLTTLNLSGVENLREFSCAFNKLTDLNLDVCTNLESFSCNGNQLVSLSLDSCTNLNYLSCDYNYLDVNDSGFAELINNINAQEDGLAEYLPQNIASNATFFQNDMDCLLKIANYETNNEILNWDINDPSSWNEVEWELNQGIYYLKGVDFRSLELSGTAEFNNCTYLDYLLISYNQFDDISLDNCTALTVLWCDYNYLDVDKLEEIVERYEDINAILLPQIKGDDKPGQKNGIHIVGLKESYEYTGAKIIPNIGVIDYDADGGRLLAPGVDYTVKYKNNTNVGTAEITVTGKGNYTGKCSINEKFSIIDADNAKTDLANLKGAKITNLETKLTYDGEAKYPKFTLTLNGGIPKQYEYNKERGVYETTDGEKEAIPANIALSNNINKGTATILLKGDNGTKIKKTFKIAAIDLAANASKVKVEVNSATYAVKGAEPASITVTYDGKKLKNGTDYTVKYSSNKKVTTAAKVVIAGKGNYAKKYSSATFAIEKLDLSNVKVSAVTAYAGLKAGKVKATVVDGQGNALKPSQYTLYVYKDENGTSPYNASELLTTGSKIYVEAVAKDTVNLDGVTPRGEFDVGTNIAKAKVTDSNGKTITKLYTGTPIMFTAENVDELKVTLNGANLEMGIDYEIVSYSNNINKGTATAVIKGIGSYSGTKTFKFKIIAKQMQIDGKTNWDDILNMIKGFMSF